MRISLNLLRTLIDCDWPHEQIAEMLTMSGTEVETIEVKGEGISRIIAARIASRKPIEGSEKLSLCQVETGQERLQVICGAPNVAEGQMVLFAPIGATIPGGVVIEKNEIRGIESYGMILSDAELDLFTE